MKTKEFTFYYWLKGGLKTPITVEALNVEQAETKAKNDVEKCYGMELAKQFNFEQFTKK